MSIIYFRMPGHRKRMARQPLAGSASGLAAEWHFSVKRPQASVSDRRSGTEGVETPHRRPPPILRIAPPPAAVSGHASDRFVPLGSGISPGRFVGGAG